MEVKSTCYLVGVLCECKIVCRVRFVGCVCTREMGREVTFICVMWVSYLSGCLCALLNKLLVIEWVSCLCGCVGWSDNLYVRTGVCAREIEGGIKPIVCYSHTKMVAFIFAVISDNGIIIHTSAILPSKGS